MSLPRAMAIQNKTKPTTPSARENFFCVGQVCRAHGLKGELYIKLPLKDSSWLPLVQQLHFTSSLKEEPTASLFLKAFRPFQKGFLAVLEGLENRSEAESFCHLQVLVTKSDLQRRKRKKKEMPFLVELMDFHLVHAEKNGKHLL